MNVTIQSTNPFTFWGLGDLELTSNTVLFTMYIEDRIKPNTGGGGGDNIVDLGVSCGYKRSDQVLTNGLGTASTRWNP